MDTYPDDVLTLEDATGSSTSDVHGSPPGGRSPGPPCGWRRFFIHRRFALFWSSRTVSALGSHITVMGLPLAALLLLHATPAQMGLLVALEALPGLLLGLVIGVWVDRLPRLLVRIVADLGRALLLVLIPLAAAFGLLHLVEFYLVTALVGLLTVGGEVASLAFLPALLPPDELALGNSRLGTSDSLAEVVGPPLAGLLIQLLTAPVAILVDVFSFLVSAFCLGRMRVDEASRTVSPRPPHLWREMREGLAVLAGQPVLRILAVSICARNFFGGSFAALYLIYVVRLFGANPLAYSLLVACGGLGALIGSFVAGWCARRCGTGHALIGSALLSGLLTFATPLAAGPAALVFMLLALSQLLGDSGFVVYAINEISVRQQLVPGHLLGRVNACMHILSTGVVPLGALLAGLLSERIGIRLTLLIGSSGMFLACTWLLFSPLRR